MTIRATLAVRFRNRMDQLAFNRPKPTASTRSHELRRYSMYLAAGNLKTIIVARNWLLDSFVLQILLTTVWDAVVAGEFVRVAVQWWWEQMVVRQPGPSFRGEYRCSLSSEGWHEILQQPPLPTPCMSGAQRALPSRRRDSCLFPISTAPRAPTRHITIPFTIASGANRMF